MIRIVGRSDHEDENIAAEKLKAAFLRWRPDIETNRDAVIILVSVQAPGHRGQQDIDLVVLARFARPLDVQWIDPERGKTQGVPMWSFCATFEIKGHELRRHDGTPQVRFVDNKVEVWYKLDDWKPATVQADGQARAFKKRLKRESGVNLWVVSFVWLIRVTGEALSGRLNEPHNTLPASFEIEALGKRILDLDPPQSDPVKGRRYAIWVRDMDFDTVAKHLTAGYAISPLNRKTVDKVLRRRIDFKQFESLGSQQQVVVGRAGSGKTMVLLRTALDFYQNGKRVAILTYNKALVADINRLLMFMKVKGPSHAPNINIITLHSYFIAVIKAVFPNERVDRKWLDEQYAQRLREVKQYLLEGAATREDIHNQMVAQDFAVFDIACIDEGQDWLDDERDILHLLVESKNCIIASGFDQLIRQDKLCDWTAASTVQSGTTRLRTCLRMKSALATFANVVANELDLPDWEVEPDDDVSGGNVIVKIGTYGDRADLHRDLVKSNEISGNKNIDMLFCVEPGNVKANGDGSRGAILAGQLKGLGHSVWDATVDENRDDPPRSVDDFRIVQFDSCRGLEGWVVVAEHLDVFFEKKKGAYEAPQETEISFLRDDDANAKAHAALWSMIPLTRAIDTLVVTIRDEQSDMGKAILAAARRMPDTVSIIR